MVKDRNLPGYGVASRGDSENLPNEAFYSAYYYFPQHVSHDDWFWAVFQWKKAYKTSSGQSHHPTWLVNVLDSGPGRMTFMLESKVDANNQYLRTNSTRAATAPVDIPIGRWVHLECFYKWSLNADGRVACWQDGVKIWDIRNVVTDFDYPWIMYPRQWIVSNYSSATTPTTHSIWVDDAAISSQRLGPTWK